MTRFAAPFDVVARLQKALREPGGSLAARRQATELASGRTLDEEPARGLIRFFEASPTKDREWDLRGGHEGRKWAAGLAKALEEPTKASLRKQLSMLLAGHGDAGCPLEALRDHVQRHGHQAVARSLRDLGAEHRSGRVHRKSQPKPKPERVSKAFVAQPAQQTTLKQRWRPMGFRRAP